MIIAQDSSAAIASLYSGADKRAGQVAAGAIAKGRSAPVGSESAIEKSANEFEAIFVAQMLEQMFPKDQGDGFFGGSYGDDVYRDWMLEQYADLLVESGGIGVAQHVKAELLKLQEAEAPVEAETTMHNNN